MICNKRNAASSGSVAAFNVLNAFNALDAFDAGDAESDDDTDRRGSNPAHELAAYDGFLLQQARMCIAALMFALLVYCLIQGVGMFNEYIALDGIVSSSTYSEQREVFLFVHTYAALVWCACVYECSFVM